jgi:putative tryptophan/tyrosine transport system substrate-binding protein
MRRREFIAGLGGVAAWPLAARAQQPARPVIGFLCGLAESDSQIAVVPAFRRGLGERGYVEGRNVEILYRYAVQYLGLEELVTDLVNRRVAVIFAFGAPVALAVKEAATTIPIVFAMGLDPVQAGLVASLNRPGGNVTGTTTLIGELTAKRLELLHYIAPAATSMGYLHDPTVAGVEESSILVAAARTLGVRLVIAGASTPNEIEPALAMLVGAGIGALFIGGNPFF